MNKNIAILFSFVIAAAQFGAGVAFGETVNTGHIGMRCFHPRQNFVGCMSDAHAALIKAGCDLGSGARTVELEYAVDVQLRSSNCLSPAKSPTGLTCPSGYEIKEVLMKWGTGPFLMPLSGFREKRGEYDVSNSICIRVSSGLVSML